MINKNNLKELRIKLQYVAFAAVTVYLSRLNQSVGDIIFTGLSVIMVLLIVLLALSTLADWITEQDSNTDES